MNHLHPLNISRIWNLEVLVYVFVVISCRRPKEEYILPVGNEHFDKMSDHDSAHESERAELETVDKRDAPNETPDGPQEKVRRERVYHSM
jgi:hypothetical protein